MAKMIQIWISRQIWRYMFKDLILREYPFKCLGSGPSEEPPVQAENCYSNRGGSFLHRTITWGHILRQRAQLTFFRVPTNGDAYQAATAWRKIWNSWQVDIRPALLLHIQHANVSQLQIPFSPAGTTQGERLYGLLTYSSSSSRHDASKQFSNLWCAADTQHCQVVFAFMKKSIQYRVSLERKQCECLGQLYYVTLRSGSPLRNATYLNMNYGRVKSNQALIVSQGVVMLTILSIF